MKKFISIVSLCMALLMLVPLLVACNDDKQDDVPVEYTYIVDGGASEYTIVLSEDATETVKGLATTLVKTIQTMTDVKLERATDNTAKYPATQHEILLGISKRSETQTAFESLTETGYKIEYTNGKIVVVASNDYMMEKAVDVLLNTYLVKEDAKLKIDDKLNVTYNGTADMTSLVDENGTFKYQIIYPDTNKNGERELATTLRSAIQSSFNCKVELAKADSMVAADDAKYEILIGKTNRSQSTEFYNNLSLLDMKARMIGNKIVVGAGMDAKLSLAITNFASAIKSVGDGTYDGKYLMALDYVYSKSVYDWLDGVPMLSKGEMLGTDDCGDNSVVMVWDNTAKDDYQTYLNELKAAGFTAKQDYTMADNLHTLLEGENATVYTSYIAMQEMTRVFVEKKNASLYPSATQASYETVSGYQATMWQLLPDNKTSEANGGMSYVMRVADGSFVIIDGGYNTAIEADNLYNHLKDNSNGEIVISAWVITHQHGDHYGALQAFTPKYKDKVTVKAFYYNFPSEGFDLGIVMENSLNNLMKQYKGAKIYRKLHTGMTFYVADAQFDVIFTHEDLYPVTKNTNTNDSGLVLRMTFGGKTVMFLADIEERASNVITDYIPASVLKSDIVQFAHHGYEGGTVLLYDTIAAPTILWPMNIYGWQRPDGSNVFENWMAKQGTSNQALANYHVCFVADYVKKIIVAGAGTTEIVLPTYEPTGDKFPDYKAIHDQIAAQEAASAS